MSPELLRALRMLVLVAAAATSPVEGVAVPEPAPRPRSTTPRPVRLTLDATRNIDLASSLDRSLAVVQRRLRSQLCHPIAAVRPYAPRPSHCRGDSLPAPFITVVLRDGTISRLVMRHGASLERHFPMGSITKLVLGVPALALEGGYIDERWCPESVPGLRNANGFEGRADCTQQGVLLPATESMATSNNLAWVWRLSQVPRERLRMHMRQAAVSLPEEVHHVPPAVAIALGMASLSPREVLECHEALMTGRASRATIVAVGSAEATPIASWCARASSPEKHRTVIGPLLRAPLRSGGTASFLPPLTDRVVFLSAKTGTATNDDTFDSAKVILFSVRAGGHRHTVLIGVASPRPNWPLGKSISGSDLRPLVESVLNDILAASPRATSVSDRTSTRPTSRRRS